ncbi:MAG: FAD-binding oxidoreductase, partial [Myxococcales bacterium]|nr:FAD-binding oxidoreductase [Myxococcales bacterium]
MSEPIAQQVLAGWGNHPRVACQVVRPETQRALRRSVAQASGAEPVIARGLGRSYGDPAVSDQGRVVDCTRLDRYVDFDPRTGLLTCDAGVSLEQILRDFVPRGFLPMISPGTKFVTVGGCIANDVHGKAHHADGCFSRCVHSMQVLLASGEVVTASPTEHADLFWASFGGMGLLGIITQATIQLRKVETTYFRQQAVVVENLDEMMDALDAHNHEPYLVAWVDSLATGDRLGRGVITLGDHATRAELPEKLASNPLAVSPPSPLAVPFEMPSGLLNTATIRALNVVLDQVQRRAAPIAHYEKFFYPLDFVGEWNRGYGGKGFTQYQFVIPLADGRAHIRELLEIIATSGQAPFLNVLKRMGPERPETMLSFPFEGYT